ncbi:MAG TPA: ABC transporter permease [Blastocatellia bacterium]|nr:ABC transporter permease [Blastocatellia bacterium]
MAGTRQTTRFHFWLWLIAFIGLIVPRRLRADWRQEWEAELRYREELLAEWDRLDWRNKLDLLCRSLGAFRDAILLQPRRLEDEMFQDLRFGLRMLWKAPSYTLIAATTLALGVGANAAIFSVVDGVLLRPLPYQNADQLIRIWSANPETGQRYLETSYQDFQQFKRQSRGFVAMAAFSEASRILRDDRGEPNHVTVARVSDSLFQILGVSPTPGRDFLPDEYERGGRSVILSHRLWQSRYSSDPGILGQTVTIDGEPHTVVGVTPQGYSYPRTADLWRPLTEEERQDDDPELSIIARLAPGVTLDQADAEVRRVAQMIAQAIPGPRENARRAAWAQTMQAMIAREVRTPLLVLLGAVALVLLIACANVANLSLARGLARRQEIAIRAALGAGRLRIARQLLTESMLIALLGGALGLLFGAWALKALALLSPNNIPRLNEVALDGRVMAVMAAVTTLAGIVFGLVPSLQASHPDLSNAINSGGRGLSKRRLRQGFVIAEVALATVLVISAGLLMKSFGRLVSFDHGFRAENVLVAPIPLRGQINPQFGAFYEQVLAEARALPGVESASLTLRTPMESQGFKFPFRVEGFPALPQSELPQAVIRPISVDYFKTVAIPLLSGQAFNDRDRAGAPAVAIINQTFAKTLFPNSEAVGQRLRSEKMDGRSILIVGVAADVTPEAGEASRPAIYVPFSQFPVPGMSLLLRTAGNPLSLAPTIRARIWALDPNVPLDKIYPLEQKVSEATTSPRFIVALVGLFAALGAALAAVGIYGVMSYAVTERTKEIGIRRALGANEAGILWTVLRQGMILTLLGLGFGLADAIWATRLLTTLLFSVSATDPLTFAGVSSLLFAVALLACYIPARRATKVDPLAALRHD